MPHPPVIADQLARAHKLMSSGQWEQAEAVCREAIALAPKESQAWFFLGLAQLNRRTIAEAEHSFRQAIVLDDRSAIYWNLLASALNEQARWQEAADASRQSLARDTGDSVAWSTLATAELMQGHLAAAQEAHERCLAIAPHRSDVMCEYALVLTRRGQPRQALAVLQPLLEREPQRAAAWIGLGHAHAQSGALASAAEAFRKALELQPGDREAGHNLAVILMQQWRLSQAQELAQQLIANDPLPAEAWSTLGTIYRMQGRTNEALTALRRSVEIEPNAIRHSRLLVTTQYAADVSLESLRAAHDAWNAAFAQPLVGAVPAATGNSSSSGPLRLGLLSADFCIHPTAFLTLGALEHLDRRQCELVGYHDGQAGDEMTARFQAAAKVWRAVDPLSDEQLAEQIRHDQIDILIDLMGHTGRRVLVFARRPAPLAVTWQGYAGTTGMAAIDYIVADRFHIRPGEEWAYAESVLRMPHDYICYSPPPDAAEVSPLPALAGGPFTFGCFNNPAKFSPPILDAWAEILRRTERSRLLLKYGGLDQPALQQRLLAEFGRRGVDDARIIFEGWSPMRELLARYSRVDLALDTQPYSGGVTTCDALWMGVPVVTSAGSTFAGRHSLSHLTNAGYEQFIAADRNAYVDLAVGWAGRIPELAALRTQMRERVRRSPLCDAPAFACDLLSLLRQSWQSRAERRRD